MGRKQVCPKCHGLGSVARKQCDRCHGARYIDGETGRPWHGA